MISFNIGSVYYEIVSTIDNTVQEGSKNIVSDVYESTGGVVFNVSKLLTKWDIETHLASSVGSDHFGEKIKNEISNLNIKSEYLETNFNSPTGISFVVFNKSNSKKTHYYLNTFENGPKTKKHEYIIEPNVIFSDGYEYHATLSLLNKYENSNSVLYINRLASEVMDLSKLFKTLIFSKDGAEEMTKVKLDIDNPDSLLYVYNNITDRYPNKNIIIIFDNVGIIYSNNNLVKFSKCLETNYQIENDSLFIGSYIYGLLNNFDVEKNILFSNITLSLSSKNVSKETIIPSLNDSMTLYNQKIAANQVVKNEENA